MVIINDVNNKKLLRNKVITIVDRHKLLFVEDALSYLWRDNLGTGLAYPSGYPVCDGSLDNLVGMQYRIDHLENL